MKPATAKEIRDELKHLSPDELRHVISRLARFKKENKELLSYLLFDATYEDGYKEKVMKYIDEQVCTINTDNLYYAKKSIRRILKDTKRYIKYSANKETEVELLTHFLYTLHQSAPEVFRSKVIRDLYNRQLTLIRVRISTLHEDLQHDYLKELHPLELYG